MRRHSRIAALLLTALLCLQPAAPALAAGETVTVRTAEDLVELSRSCALDSWSRGKTVVLAADLSLASVDFLPIPIFGGTFDGGGHTVSGLSLDGRLAPAGLFGVIQEGAVVKDLNVSGKVSPSGSGGPAGGLAGENRGVLQNCSFTGTVTGSDRVGGIAGLNTLTGKLEGCVSSGSVTGTSMTGGVVGENLGVVSACRNKSYVNITSLDPGVDLSELELRTDLLTLRSLDAANIATDTGGVAGLSSGLILSCANDGLVGCQHVGYNVGGVAGRSSGFLSGCVNRGEVYGRKDVGGIVGQAEPYIVLDLSQDTIEKLRGQMDELERLVNRSADDAQGVSGDLSGRFDDVNDALDSASELARALGDKATGYGDDLVSELDRGSDILNDALDRLSDIAEQADGLSGRFGGGLDAMADAVRELAKTGDYADGAVRELEDAADELAAAADLLESGAAHIRAGLKALAAAVEAEDQSAADAAMDRITQGAGDLSAAMTKIGAALQYLSGALPGAGGDGEGPGSTQEAVELLRSALGEAGTALKQIGEGLDSLNKNISFNSAEFRRGMLEIGTGLSQLSNAAGAFGDGMRELKDALEEAGPATGRIQSALEELADAAGLLGDACGDSEPVLDSVRDLADFLAGADPIQIARPGGALGTASDDLFDALNLLGDRLDALNRAASGSTSVLAADVRAVNRQFNDILETILDAADDDAGWDGEDVVTDASETDVDSVTSGKILSCVNRGTVHGDLCAGGVAGSMAVEYELDPEDDALSSDVPVYRRAYEMKVILQSCVNEGEVVSRRDWAGGLCGRMSLGLILSCEGYGRISSENGDYVGGLAGFSAGTIRDSWSKCVLSGGRYVGGVVGAAGIEGSGEGGLVSRCVSFVRAAKYEQDAGAVSGAALGSFRNNVFVSDELAGLGRVSLAGEAEPVSYEKLLDTQGLPSKFKRLTVRFLADGRIVRTVELPYGGSLSAGTFPDPPEREGEYAVWDAGDLENLRFDADVTAVYAPRLTALPSAQLRSDGRPVFFVEGRFGGGDALSIREVPDGEAPVGSGPAALNRGVERWDLVVPEDGQPVHTLRYLSPNGSPDGLEVFLLRGTEWKKLDAGAVGSYLIFDVEGNSPTVAVVTQGGVWWLWIVIGFGVVALILALRTLAQWIKSRKKKAAPDPGRKRRRIAAAVCGVLAAVTALAAYLVASGTLDRLSAAKILGDYLRQEEYAMDLTVRAEVGEERWSAGAELFRIPLEGESVTAARQFGAVVCYRGGNVYLENGAVFSLGEGVFPDYGGLPDQIRAMYKLGRASVFANGEERIYSLSLEGERAQALFQSLIPEVGDAALERLDVSLSARSGRFTALRFEGAGALTGGQAVVLTAALTARDEWEAPVISEAARTAILAGEAPKDGEDLLRLLSAWGRLNLMDPLSVQMTLSADCGPLVVGDQMELFRTWTGGKRVVCLRRAGKDVYFSGGKLYDAEGNILALEDASAGPAAREELLELAYRLCLRGQADCQERDGGYLYTLDLDLKDLEEAAQAILPQIQALEPSLTGGRLEVMVAEDTVERVELSCGGSMRVLLTDARVSLSCGLSFEKRDFELPEDVAEAVWRDE